MYVLPPTDFISHNPVRRKAALLSNQRPNTGSLGLKSISTRQILKGLAQGLALHNLTNLLTAAIGPTAIVPMAVPIASVPDALHVEESLSHGHQGTMPCSPDHRDAAEPVRPSDAKGRIGTVVMMSKRLICAKHCYVPTAGSAGTHIQAIDKPCTAFTTMNCTHVLTPSPPRIASNACP